MPKKYQIHYRIQRNQVCIYGDIYRPPTSVPQPQEQTRLNKILHTANEAITEQENYFKACVTKTDSIKKYKMPILELLRSVETQIILCVQTL